MEGKGKGERGKGKGNGGRERGEDRGEEMGVLDLPLNDIWSPYLLVNGDKVMPKSRTK